MWDIHSMFKHLKGCPRVKLADSVNVCAAPVPPGYTYFVCIHSLLSLSHCLISLPQNFGRSSGTGFQH